MQQGNSGGETKKDFIQKYVFNNIGIKLLALFSAIVVWVAIVNIEDPYKERTFNVEVETINEDALSSVNKVYEIIEGSTAQVRYIGAEAVVGHIAPGVQLHAERLGHIVLAAHETGGDKGQLAVVGELFAGG